LDRRLALPLVEVPWQSRRSFMITRTMTTPPSPDQGSNHARHGSGPRVRQSDPDEELRLVAEVRSTSHPEDYVIGGQVDRERQEVLLVRGDFSQIVVPFGWFAPTPDGVAPDFDDFRIVDTGETLAFGQYTTPSSAVLGQHDLKVLRA
jgi:hypothetical protein